MLLLCFYGLLGGVTPYIVLVLALIGGAALLVSRPTRLIPDAAGWGMILAFALMTVAQALVDQKPSVPIVYNFVWLLVLLPLTGVMRGISRPDAARIVAWVALAGAAATFFFALYQRVALGMGRVGYVNSDAIRIANTAAILGLASLVGFVAEPSRLRFAMILGPGFALGVGILAQTRGAMLTVLITSAAAVVILAADRRRALIRGLVVLAAGTVALVVAAYFRFARADLIFRVAGRLLSGEKITDDSSRVRWNLLRSGWSAFLDSPIYGHGFSRLIVSIKPYLPPDETNLFGAPHLHNDLMNFLVAYGLFGLAAYIIILVSPLTAAAKSRNDISRRARTAGVAIVVTTYVVLGLNALTFGYELHSLLYVALMAIFLGFCSGAQEARR